ncbi:trypsin-like serine protease [Streptomyces sp. NPDC058855]|uniref:trypsin-like serine protease n=1 Tax=Streptomyces sp. NPDC058855 TaxID=3346651 RepID=UPI00369908D9
MHHRATRLAVATMAVAALSAPLAGSAVAVDTPTTPAETPFAFEDGAYPNAEQILAERGIKLIRGDGNVLLADCDPNAKQIRVMAVKDSSVNREGTYCFVSRASTGLLTLELDRVFAIDAADQPLSASLTAADGTSKTVTIAKDGYASVGEGQAGGTRSKLVEIRVTGPSGTAPAPSGDATFAFTGKLTVGDSKRMCTSVLVDPNWVLTAKSCLADNPAESNTVTAGAPKEKTTVTVGRTDLATSGGHTTDITQLVPHPDRDLVMARLAQPATTVTPVALSATAPTAGEELTVAGFGRTGTEWAPSKVHTAVFTAGSPADTGLPLTAKTPADATVCKGDAGAPALRTENGKPALVALGSRSSQAGCLGTPATDNLGAWDTRTDNARDWIQQTRALVTGWKTEAVVQGGTKLFQGIRLADGTWTDFADVEAKAGPIGGVRASTVAGINGDTHIVALGGDGKLRHTLRRADGTWTGFGDVNAVAGALSNITQVSAVSTGYELHVVAVAGGKPYHTIRRQNGTWTPFGDVTGAAGAIGSVTAIATANTNGQLHVVAVAGGKAYHSIRATNGVWAKWGDVASAAGATGPISSLAMAGVGSDAHLVIATDNGTRQYHALRRGDATWAPFGNLTGYLGQPTAKSLGAAHVNGELQVAVTTQDGKLLHTVRHTDATWAPTTPVTLTGLTGTPGGVAVAGTM